MLMEEWQSWPTVLRAYTAAQHLGLITAGELFTVGEPFGQLASPLLSWRALCSKILEKRVLASPMSLPFHSWRAKSNQGFANCEKAYGQL